MLLVSQLEIVDAATDLVKLATLTRVWRAAAVRSIK